ncbi:MAG: hypothetical protein IID39_07685, partial [Planctomycetes bacterium]|nr:hypothetical protein [Planctomycetota bacterium]
APELIGIGTVLLALAGCQLAPMDGAVGARLNARLLSAYPDLIAGQFVVVADFEQPGQLELFEIVSSSGRAVAGPASIQGPDRGGDGCIRVTLAAPMDRLSLSNARAQRHFLRTDWTDFNLLNMNVYCPLPSIDLEVTLVSGTKAYRATAHSRIPLRAGWNPLRLDLAEAAEHIELDDVREINWSLPSVESATELLIDDIILTDNRLVLLGDPGNIDGNLYVERRGRRWHIGAGGRFELAFSHGQVVSWHDLSDGSERTGNLLGTAVLGPTPIVLPEQERDVDDRASDFAHLGEVVVARQWIEEASSVRVILGGEWRFVSGDQTPDASSPFQRWTYTIYSTGQIYVHTECTTETADWRAGEIGLAVSRHDDPTLEVFVHRAARLSDPEPLRHISFAYARSPEVPPLLVAVHDARAAPLFDVLHDRREHRLHLVASGGRTQRPVQTWDCMLTLWPTDACRGDDAVARVRNYSEGPPMRLTKGRWVTDLPGDGNGDGFDEQHGCYVLEADGEEIELKLDGHKRPIHNPCFVVQGTADRDGAVYVNYALHEPVDRDGQGNILFQIPFVVTNETVIEIHLGERPATPPQP